MNFGPSNFKKQIPLFMPNVPEIAKSRVQETLNTRWIGQGPQVDEFEMRFSRTFCDNSPVAAVGSGTDALHLAYLLANISKGDEVIAPVFTCTATNIPLLYIGAKIIFADIDPRTLNIDPRDVRQKITKNTKAIVCVHYGGLPCDMEELQELADEFGIPIIEDAAHAVGAKYDGHSIGSISDFTIFSFQAIKHITTGDGGMVSFRNSELLPLAKKLRWFGIDRVSKEKGIWDNDINEIGYKYQMTDIAASMGLGGLDVWTDTESLREKLYRHYVVELQTAERVQIVDDFSTRKKHAHWMFTILVEERAELQKLLLSQGIESGQVHYRNDRYSIFKESKGEFPNMDSIENKYLVLPLHTGMNIEDVKRICNIIKNDW